jgi:excisionase family DNA binding protein
MADEKLLTVREVARACSRSEETVRRWIWSGKLPARKLGNQLFIEEGDVSRLLQGRISEAQVEYRTSPVRRQRSRKGPIDMTTRKLFEEYEYADWLEDLREHRGDVFYSKEEALRHIEEDEAFQDDLLAKFGSVDVVDLVRKVRDE